MIETFRIRRPSLIGTAIRGIGELVPEAHLWRLVDGMVRGGRLLHVDVSEAEFVAAVQRFCPEQADEIYAKVGVTPVRTPEVTRRGKVSAKPPRTVVTTAPTLLDQG